MIATNRVDGRAELQAGTELVLADLLHDFGELTKLLASELERESWLDAFLLAVGMNQVTEDYLHRDFASLSKIAASISHTASLGSLVAVPLRVARRLGSRLRGLTPAERSVACWQSDVEELVLALAKRVATPTWSSGHAVRPASAALLARAGALTRGLRREVVRLPSCFRSLDLRPEDMHLLAERFAERRPDRSRQLLVIGIRTSGSYLAPLEAAYLTDLGFESVAVKTLRPGDELLERERRELRRAAATASIAVVVDDPPSSGRAVASTATLLQRCGFATSDIVLTLPLLTRRAAVPDTLEEFETILLERDEWAIESRLDPTEVHAALQEMPEAPSVERVRRLPVPEIDDPWEEAGDRRHARGLYEVELRLPGGTQANRCVYAKGVGLGYFGRHSLAVADGLREYLPELYGLRGGLLFRSWQPEARRVRPDRSPDLMPERIAAYVDARRRALVVERDPTLGMLGRQTVWQRTADLLLEPLGRLRLPLRPIVHRLAKHVLHTETPSVVDGSMGLNHWFTSPKPNTAAVKVDYDERAFSNEDIYSYDAAYDLGSAAASLRAQVGPEQVVNMRAAYESVAGKVDDERWFLYQLLTSRLQRGILRSNLRGDQSVTTDPLIALLDRVETSLEDAQREYMRTLFLRDVGHRQDGPLCAIDIDGTLETAPLGYTSIGPAGAMALRALARHGFRVVLASGRSLDEVRARCEAYSLAAGVAEYGAVVYDCVKRESVELLSNPDRINLSRVRSALASAPGIYMDERYQRSVRAFTLDRRGRRRGLSPVIAKLALTDARVGPAVMAIPGWSQTDFVSTSVNKADGLRVAAARMRLVSRPTLVELAVGDATTDIPMFGVARLACAPADADARLRSYGVAVMRRSGQEGLAEAVGRLIGHGPGECGECRAPRPRSQARMLLNLLRLYDRRGWSRLAGAALLALGVRGTK